MMTCRVLNQFGEPPPLRFLRGESAKSRIIRLRDAVAPILANNLLPHFTDHSIAHSDNVTELVDDLIAPLQGGDEKLSEQELAILYCACFLHDIGMQYEKAGSTQVVRDLDLAERWDDLAEETRREILREYHHRISAEMVTMSVRSESPIIGLQLDEGYDPARIACLCEAHATETNSDRYRTLTADGPDIRMTLIAALLRLADILDESRRRACLEKARTLNLSMESQSHWWRHYYTEGITFDEGARTINIWFDFPPERFNDYSRVVPELQRPHIEAELNRHFKELSKYHLGWRLVSQLKTTPYSATKCMPEDVMVEMLTQLRNQHLREENAKKQVVLQTFRAARPYVARRLEEVRLRKNSLSPADYLRQLAEVSSQLWQIGSKRSAWMALSGEFELGLQNLDISDRVTMGTRLMEMLIEDDEPELARPWVEQLHNDARTLPKGDRRAAVCLRAVATWLLQMFACDDAAKAFEEAIAATSDNTEASRLRARIKEVLFFQGDPARAIKGIRGSGGVDD
jgi:hypothetical protein